MRTLHIIHRDCLAFTWKAPRYHLGPSSRLYSISSNSDLTYTHHPHINYIILNFLHILQPDRISEENGRQNVQTRNCQQVWRPQTRIAHASNGSQGQIENESNEVQSR